MSLEYVQTQLIDKVQANWSMSADCQSETRPKKNGFCGGGAKSVPDNDVSNFTSILNSMLSIHESCLTNIFVISQSVLGL